MKLIITVLLAGLVFTSAQQKEDTAQVAGCECAVFQDEKPASDAKPLLVKIPIMNINCTDLKAKEDCKKMCVALASASKDQAPQVLCEAVKIHVDHMKPAVFYKVCDIDKWEYSGLTANKTICCHDGSPKTCGTTSAAPDTQPPKERSVSPLAPAPTNESVSTVPPPTTNESVSSVAPPTT